MQLLLHFQVSLQLLIDPTKTQYALIYDDYKTIPLTYLLYAGDTAQILAKLYNESSQMLTCADIDITNNLNKQFNFSLNYTQVKYLPTPSIGNITCENDIVHIPVTTYSNLSNISLVINILMTEQNNISIQSSTRQILFEIQPGSISTLLSGPLKSKYKINMADPLAINFLLIDQYGNVKNALCCSQCFQYNLSEAQMTMEPIYSKLSNDSVCQIYYVVRQHTFKQKINISFTFNTDLLQGLANNQPWFYEIFNESYILSSRVQVSIQNGTDRELLCDMIIGVLLIVLSIILFFIIFEKKRKLLMEEDKKQKEKIKKMLLKSNVAENTQENVMNTVDSSQIATQILAYNEKKRNVDEYEKALDQSDMLYATSLNTAK